MRPDVKQITSLANATVKTLRGLHLRKTREESGLFLAEGMKIAGEALAAGLAPRVLMYGAEARPLPLLERLIEGTLEAGGEVLEVDRPILEKVSRRDNPQTVVAAFEQRFADLPQLDPTTHRVWVALEAVRDPGNLGTIVRTADAAGCGGVILVGGCCDPYSVEAVRATMGSIFAVPLFRVDTQGFLSWREAWPGRVIGTHLEATTNYRAADYGRPTLLVMGNEQAGLTPALTTACDFAVKIPMRGRADSLNLAVATGIVIYAAAC